MSTNPLAPAQALGTREHDKCQGLTVCEECAAAYVGVGVSLFQQEVRRHVPPIPIGKRRLVYARKALDRFIDRRIEEEACRVKPGRAAGPVRKSTRSQTEASSGVASPSKAGSTGDPLVKSILARLKPPLEPSGSGS